MTTPPKVDPNFPDRPQHPDFWALSEAVCQQDNYADFGMTVAEIIDMAKIDPDSLFYVAKQRGLRLFQSMPDASTPEEVIGSLAAIWIDAFLAGLKVGDGRTMIDVEQVLDADGNRRQGGG